MRARIAAGLHFSDYGELALRWIDPERPLPTNSMETPIVRLRPQP